jgi:hypothetical protein
MIFDKDGLVINEYDSETETSALIIECAILDAFSSEEIESLTENTYDLGKAINEDILVERSIVRLDKEAKKNRAYKMAIFQVAKEKGDRDFKKLLTLWKLERFIEQKLEKRYFAQAKQKAKEAMKKAKMTKSKVVAKATDKANLLLGKGNPPKDGE